MKEEERKTFEAALKTAWKNYVDRGAATVDALEDNTQELAFAKGFKAGCEQGYKDAVIKACGWLNESMEDLTRYYEDFEMHDVVVSDYTIKEEFIEAFKKAMEE